MNRILENLKRIKSTWDPDVFRALELEPGWNDLDDGTRIFRKEKTIIPNSKVVYSLDTHLSPSCSSEWNKIWSPLYDAGRFGFRQTPHLTQASIIAIVGEISVRNLPFIHSFFSTPRDFLLVWIRPLNSNTYMSFSGQKMDFDLIIQRSPPSPKTVLSSLIEICN
ncbi:MAG: hypothetical protein SGI71_10820 [Verrucomicrobiota bacterium]|nr:hypothetical protein [Verrucomicrobiota bacterium]